MRTCPAGMGGGVCAFSEIGAAVNNKQESARKVKTARRCMVHTPGLVVRFIFLKTLPHEMPANRLRTFPAFVYWRAAHDSAGFCGCLVKQLRVNPLERWGTGFLEGKVL